jgi:hypothetical protein
MFIFMYMEFVFGYAVASTNGSDRRTNRKRLVFENYPSVFLAYCMFNFINAEKVKKKVLTVNEIHYIMCIVSNESFSTN